MFQSIATLSVSINLQKKRETSAERDRNACREGSYTSCACAGKHGGRYKKYVFKSKTSSRFPNFDAGNAWQMGHNSQEGFFSRARTALGLCCLDRSDFKRR